MNDYTDEQAHIKAYFIKERGYWRPWNETILRHNPSFLKHYAVYAGYPARNGPLSPRMIELIYIALDASATHLFAAGLRTHLGFARKLGVTPAEVFDVLHLVACQGLSHVYDAVGILAEESGTEEVDALSEQQRMRIRQYFREIPPFIKQLAQLDKAYLDVLLDFLEEGGVMQPEGLALTERLLIEIALAACFTGFNANMLRLRIRGALNLGVTRAEILQAIQLGAHLSIHGTALGATEFEEI